MTPNVPERGRNRVARANILRTVSVRGNTLNPKLRQGFYLDGRRVHPPSGTIEGPQGPTHLQPESMELLLCLVQAPGEIISRENFMRELWPDRDVGRDAVSDCISEIRRAFDDHHAEPKLIQTIPNRGYRLLIEPQFGPSDTGNTDHPAQDGARQSRLLQLIAEAREREVFKSAGIYLMVAWLIIQVIGEICGPLECPSDLARNAIILLIAGFPLALVAAWFVDLRLTPGSSTWLDIGFVVVSGAAVGLFLYLAVVYRTPGPVPTAANSIAIMPFADLSEKQDQDYFCKGIAEQIIYQLSLLPDLEVASRTDTFSMPPEVTIADIGEQLGVKHVLEGSVRRQDDLLRITAQLIDSQTRFHVWSREYERSQADVFSIQDDIARHVAQTLDLVLKAGQEADVPRNLKAYEAYLRGREKLRGQRTRDALTEAERLFTAAIAVEPNYAAAHAGLCETYLSMYEISRAKEFFDRAEDSCNVALNREFSSGSVHVALGNLYRVSGEYRKAQRHFNRAIAIYPYDADAYVGKARTFARQNKIGKAEKTLARTLEFQPRFARGHTQMGNLLFNDGRYREAIRFYETVVRQGRDVASALNNLGSAYYMLGEFDAATREWRRSLSLEPTPTAYSNLGSSLYYSREYDEAVAMYENAVAEAPEDYELHANLAFALRQSGATARARDVFRRAAALAEIALDVNASDAVATSVLAVSYAALDIGERARELVVAAERLAPRDPYTHYDAARVRVLLGEPQAAVESLRRAVELGYPTTLIPPDAVFDSLQQHPDFSTIIQSDST